MGTLYEQKISSHFQKCTGSTIWANIWALIYLRVSRSNYSEKKKYGVSWVMLHHISNWDSCYRPGHRGGGNPPPLFEPWNHHHWIRNFVLPQKYVKNFAVAQKLWILRPFFKIFLLRKQLLVENHWYFNKKWIIYQCWHIFDKI